MNAETFKKLLLDAYEKKRYVLDLTKMTEPKRLPSPEIRGRGIGSFD
jgi:hypothetical protein